MLARLRSKCLQQTGQNKENEMSNTVAAEPSVSEDPFALDVQIVTDIPPGDPLFACGEGTNDGCQPTCASACVTGGV
jgi:FxLD family lantipeptide